MNIKEHQPKDLFLLDWWTYSCIILQIFSNTVIPEFDPKLRHVQFDWSWL
jgi:hypothetical protein